MKLQTLSSLLSLSVFTLAGPVADKVLEARAGTTPTPTGSACPVVEADPTISVALSATELAVAVAGCVGVELQGADDTRNDIVDGECKPFTLIFARGTGEDPNLGNIVGPPFVVALDAVFGTSNVAVQGVNDYAADVLGFCEGGSATGATDLVQVGMLLALITTSPEPATRSIFHHMPFRSHSRLQTLTDPSYSTANRTNPIPMPEDQTLRQRVQPRCPSGARCRGTALDVCDQLHQLGRPLWRSRSSIPRRKHPVLQSQQGLPCGRQYLSGWRECPFPALDVLSRCRVGSGVRKGAKFCI